MEIVTIQIVGTAPLLMHNGQLADPLNDYARELSAAVKLQKQTKTDVTIEAAMKCEFVGGLYLDENKEPCIPGELLEAMICEGAKKSKQGKEVKAGVIVDGAYSLDYAGPRTVEKLWKGKFFKTSGVRIGKNRIMRTRPEFSNWSCTFDVHYNPELINAKDLIKFVEKAGLEVGLGDFRPRYGRFVVVK